MKNLMTKVQIFLLTANIVHIFYAISYYPFIPRIFALLKLTVQSSVLVLVWIKFIHLGMISQHRFIR